ncbi:MAG TPA: hypothetical protein VNH11_16230 [Pirellulales bacterium]|nr:hypothetical protein [Pirellulales bacterium]
MSHRRFTLGVASLLGGLVLAGWQSQLFFVAEVATASAAQKEEADSATGKKAAPNAAEGTQAERRQANQRRRRAQQQANVAAPGPREAASEGGVPVLSTGDSYDDFASVAQAPDGSLYAAYAAYFDGYDQIRLHKRLPDGTWSTRTHVPLVHARPDIWMPQLAVDAENRVWVLWCEQSPASKDAPGNWDLYARSFSGDSWSDLVRLTDDPKPDIHPHVAIDARHNIYVVWQAHPDNTGDIQLCKFDGQTWSKPLAVTSGAASDWHPHVAIDGQGTAWIAFDSYRNGDYDVFLTSVNDGVVGDLVPIATSRFYEAHASVACTPDGRVWVAWEQGGYLWGKDQGYWLKQTNKNVGTVLGSPRQVHVAAWQDGRLLAAPPVDSKLPENAPRGTAMPALAADADGRLWLRFRRHQRGAPPPNRPLQGRSYWTENVTHLTTDGWADPTMLPNSTGRISVFSRVVPLAEGGLAIAYSSDQRRPPNYHQPLRDQALVTTLARPDEPAGCPDLAAYMPPAPPEKAGQWDDERETRQVAAIREHEEQIGGEKMRIVRGDLHRHTELSWDVGPAGDGSFLDFYRYMIDVAAMDFGGLTDHQGGGHYPYHWWLIEKSADLYYLPPRFVPLYSYERSAQFPHGHRNVFHSYRGVPVFPFQIKLTQTGVFPGVGTGNLSDDDTKLLYQYLHGTGGLAISHTSATSTMGTDWRDNDPEIEPVVEIYQGARNSYEVVGGPRVHDVANAPPADAPGGYQEEGLVWNALAKGYRLGMTSSSDHGSTHISYSMVYTPKNDRQSILDAVRRRHTYGATDNLIVAARANGHFMGEEFTTAQRPALELHVAATDKIARIDLVRNNVYIYTTSPLRENADLKYVDMEPKAGLNYYYFRIQQDDGQIAWASPLWIHYEPK